jgi:hypothetical protein
LSVVKSISTIDLKEEAIKTEGCKLLLQILQFLTQVGVIQFPKTAVYSSLDLTTVKYNKYVHSRDEKAKITL